MTSRRAVRALVAVLAGSGCGVALTCGALALAGDADPVRDGDAGVALVAAGRLAGAGGSPREVLRRWDAERAAAWKAGDTDALARLYTPGSGAGRADVAMLRAWNRRGLRVTAMTTQVLSLRVPVDGEHRLVLRVTDRLVGVEAGSVTLPRDEVSTRTIELRRVADQPWRVAAVSDR